ncbi:putative potassium transporter 17 [Camellia lanceoleosa]|uniref:Potassium transporter 17 n=1 Tax=Camellia lanceoleosa TaxID=1840588 RepID=A0ACC0G340_9ERIC|nr:putative potassium transporter 17 [Camellia lanceoleosa]
MLGMCMLIGDGILTPAISVLSAIDGIRAPFPSVSKTLVEVMSAVVLIVLFLLQKYGTSRFFLRNGKEGWVLLGGTVLCITGSEALFADLGHFNRKSIQLAFLFTIYPSLVLTYAGQTAYLIKNPNDHDDGFYKFIPKTIYWPMFIVATLAAIVASQSLISATFSIIKQSVTLDYFPRVKVLHTSSKKEGEVYCPEINYILMILCVAVILIFGDGKDIGNAFGVVVSLVMLITTILLTLVMIMIWRTPPVLVALYFTIYFVMGGVYHSRRFDPNSRALHKEHEISSQGYYFHYLRYLLVPRVAPHERIVVSKLGLKGYTDVWFNMVMLILLILKKTIFVSQVIDRLRAHILNGSDYATSVTSELEEEMSDMEEAKLTGAVHVRGKTRFYVSIACSGVPLSQRVEVGMLYEV